MRGLSVNQYGAQAQAHWRTFRPQEYQSLPDPDRFFEELGEEAARQVDDLTDALTRQHPAGESYLDNLAHRTTARRQAEEKVRTELLLLPPESTHPDADQDEEPDEDLERGLMATPWAPLREDPADPFWQQQENLPGR